jgi:hypothetical protein
MVLRRRLMRAMLLPLHPPRLLLLLLLLLRLRCCLSMLLQHMWHARWRLAGVMLLLHALPRSQVCRRVQLLLLHGQHACMAKPHLPALSGVLRLILASGRWVCP